LPDSVYIQFEVHKEVDRSPEKNPIKKSIKTFIVNIVSKVIPTANPDFEDSIGSVRHWLVECDRLTGIPKREIGLNSHGQAIVKMPFKDNYGYWTDNNMLLDEFKKQFDVSEIPEKYFQNYWNTIMSANSDDQAI
jgi:hypothetical protein